MTVRRHLDRMLDDVADVLVLPVACVFLLTLIAVEFYARKRGDR